MFSHEDMWRAIDRLADSHGYSPSGLAKKAGLDPTTFNKSKRISSDGKPRWPSTESLSKILAVTGATMSDFLALSGADLAQTGAGDRPTIPLMNLAGAATASHYSEAGHPAGEEWDDFTFPETVTLRDKNIFALEIHDNSFHPVYREGDILVVSPEAHIRRGDRVVMLTNKQELVIHELKRQTASKLEYMALGKAQSRQIATDDIVWMARIIWVSQ
ncbi:MAG: S24 family peptidase [Micavibrio sp.]